MILANVAAAETLERARTPLIYRVHDEPGPEKIESLREFLASIELSMPKGQTIHTAQFNYILKRVKGTDVEETGEPDHPAVAVAGGIRRRELRSLRTKSAQVCAFHVADPPLR